MTGAVISIGIVLTCAVTIAVTVLYYFRLQTHRADAVAMAGYRKLAEQAVTNQEQLNRQLAMLVDRVSALEVGVHEVTAERAR